jgi:uncharacterized protein (UPF0332 family)
MQKASQALASARSERDADRLDFAVNRSYYACYYAASAALMKLGKTFVKHSGLRGAIHKDLAKPGRIEPRWGKVFDRAFANRHSADYMVMSEFEREQVDDLINESHGFVQEMALLLER